MFRNAAAFGFDAVLLSPRCCDPLYRRAVRVSLGYALLVPFATLDPWPDALAGLGQVGISLLALTPRRDAVDVRDVVCRADDRVAVLLGTEGAGLSDGAMSHAARMVRIEMAAGVDSLNVATAGAIAFHHLARPRQPPSSGGPTHTGHT